MPSVSETAFLESVFDGGCAVPFGLEIADINDRRSGRWGRRTRFLGALGAIVALHALLFLNWHAERTPAQTAPGPGFGAGGLQVSLVSALPGGPFAETTAPNLAEPEKAEGALEQPQSAAQPSADSSGSKGSNASVADTGHSEGAVGAGTGHAAAGMPGGGYDPGAFASLAPLSFSQHAEPGFWEQVQRCFKNAPAREVTLTVVLDEKGGFIDAYKETGALSVAPPSPEEISSAQATIDALRACSPYHDLPGGLNHRLVLTVPGQASGVPAA